eukprot:3866326-Rhodomonas_salina.2
MPTADASAGCNPSALHAHRRRNKTIEVPRQNSWADVYPVSNAQLCREEGATGHCERTEQRQRARSERSNA